MLITAIGATSTAGELSGSKLGHWCESTRYALWHEAGQIPGVLGKRWETLLNLAAEKVIGSLKTRLLLTGSSSGLRARDMRTLSEVRGHTV